jgi:HK97 family phage portal protein
VNILDAITERGRERTSYLPWDDFWYGEAGQAATLAGVRVTTDSAMQLSAVSACVRLISGVGGRLPAPVYRRLPGEGRGRERLDSHPLFQRLNRKPNRWQSWYEFRRQMLASVALWGNAYAQKVPGFSGPYEELVPWHPQNVRPEQREDGSIDYHVRTRKGATKTFAQDQVWHWRDLSLDGVVGISRIAQARLGISVARAADVYAAAFFENGAEGGVGFTADGKVEKDARERILASWRASHQGPQKAFTPFVAEGGLKLMNMASNNKDAQLIELRSFQVVDIGRWFGVPPNLLFEMTKQTTWGSGIEATNAAFLMLCMLDWLVMVESSACAQMFSDDERELLYLEHDVDALQRGVDFKSRMDGFAVAIDRGVFSPDEVRAMENFNPRPDGHGGEYRCQANTMPAGDASPTEPDPNTDDEDAEGKGDTP